MSVLSVNAEHPSFGERSFPVLMLDVDYLTAGEIYSPVMNLPICLLTLLSTIIFFHLHIQLLHEQLTTFSLD